MLRQILEESGEDAQPTQRCRDAGIVRRHSMDNHLGKETVVHGRPWDTVHGGYFSDPALVRPLVEAAGGILTKAPADVIVDLGGGTGFLLSQLAAQRVAAGAALVNVDSSAAQLVQAQGRGVATIRTPVEDFQRADLADPDKRFFFLMRSVLHYFGQEGLSPLLRHLRDQAVEGEFFLHQSASFEIGEDAACLNALYRHMHTRKWYPTVTELTRRLAEAGWHVTTTTAAPSLRLTAEDLAKRYALDTGEIQRIRDTVARECGERKNIFQLTPAGFEAHLHYRIYTCVAQTL